MSDTYCTLTDLKSALSLTTTDYDSLLTAAIEAGARAIDDKTGRRFYPDTDANQVRKYWPVSPGFCLIDDLCTLTSVADFSGQAMTLNTDFYLEPVNAAAKGEPYTAIRTIARPFLFTQQEMAPGGWLLVDGRITVTGMFGWSSAPGPIQQANILLASRLFKRLREAPFGMVSGGLDQPSMRISRLDPDVEALLAPYSLTFIA